MADYIPSFKPGEAVTFTASANVTGGRVVLASGARTVAHATADSAAVVGVAGFDAANGDRVTVFTRAGGIHSLVAAGAIAAGVAVAAAADGKVATAGTNKIGIAITAADEADDVVDVLFT